MPMIAEALVMAISSGDTLIDNGANLILLGGPGGGKSQLSSAIGLALVENGCRMMFTRPSDLVQRLQIARRELALEAAMTLAAADRLVHHDTIFEMNVESYRRRAAIERKQKGAGRPASYATIKSVGPLSASDNHVEHLRPVAITDSHPDCRKPSPRSSRNTPSLTTY